MRALSLNAGITILNCGWAITCRTFTELAINFLSGEKKVPPFNHTATIGRSNNDFGRKVIHNGTSFVLKAKGLAVTEKTRLALLLNS